MNHDKNGDDLATYNALIEEFKNMHKWSIKNIEWTWETIKIYLQVVGLLFALEGYILAEYTLPLLTSENYQLATGPLLVCWFLTLVIMLIGWHTRRMLSRSYSRFLETIAVVTMIRYKLRLLDYNIYPERWIKSWNVLLFGGNRWKKFIEENMERKDTAYAQMLFITRLLDLTMLFTMITLTTILLCNILL